MAFVTGLYGVTYSFVDNGGNQVTRDYAMKSTILNYGDAVTAATDSQPVVDALTGATMPKFRVYQEFVNNAFVLPGDAGVQVENQASMTFLLAGVGAKKANLNIPAPIIGIFVGSSGPNANIVAIDDPAVEAFADLFIGAGPFRLSDGEVSQRMLNGKRVHKRSSKG